MESIGCVGDASMAKALAALSVAPRHSFVAGLRFAPAAALLCGAVLPTMSLCLGASPSQCQAADFGGNEVLAQVGIDLGLFDVGVAEEAL